ncbi:MAG: hypothetical protein ACK476_03110 [Fluviicola sp.]|jgi:hypothetical protein
MKKSQKTLILLTIFGCLSVWGLFYINKHYYVIWNANTTEVKTDKKLDPSKVKIFFGISANTINRINDELVFSDMDKYLTIYNGREENKIFNEYGENDFLITYDDRFYLTFRHFKLHHRAQHNYLFNFIKMDNSVILEVKIEGQDKMKFRHKMIPITDAKSFRTNVPVDEAGTVYNGVELNK